jgi:2-oxoglutarate/2-oxoacid ferredoxin oxidoreductase subunit alpha
MREFITGNQAIVRGAVRAGCNFVAGYPITPASSILTEVLRAFADGSGVVVQTEDEIAAIGQCIGASMAGAKVMTATSGPGISLYSENIGLAQMGEAPLVIVDCQRMGPATGGATATGDGDVMFARHVTSGSYPIPVIAATDATTAYRLAYEAFNIAERLRTPVILLSSKAIALTRQTVDLEKVQLSPCVERKAAAPDATFHPYKVDQPGGVPDFAPIGGSQRVRFTGSIHDEEGVLTIERDQIDAKLQRLNTKILAGSDALELVDEDFDDSTETLVVSYGLADGAAREAVRQSRDCGAMVSHLTLYSLWPVPAKAIRRAVTPSIKRVIVPELNLGLYVEEIRKLLPGIDVMSIQRIDGGLIEPQRIVSAVTADSPCGCRCGGQSK